MNDIQSHTVLADALVLFGVTGDLAYIIHYIESTNTRFLST